jgi:hypothetical protein
MVRWRWVVAAVVVGVVAAVLYVLLRPESVAPEPGDVTPQPSARVEPVAPRWNQPITEKRGAKQLEGLVTLDGTPVAGAVVTALANHGEDVLSDLPCRCDNHCGRKLLACGCGEAAAQLVELVSARTGEAAPIARATSDANGHFVLDGLDDTELALWADAREGIAWSAGLHAGDAAVKLELSRGRTIEGRVKGEDEQPLAGALVTAIFAEHSRFFDTQSDAQGHVRLGPLLPGDYAVVEVSSGLLPDNRQVSADDDEPVSLTLAMPRALEGVVRADGQAVSGATVKLDGMHRKRTVTSDAQGRFRFEQLRAGEYELDAEATAGRAHASTVLSKKRKPEALELVLNRGVDVEGVVVDERGAPVAGALAFVAEGEVWRRAEADETGHFSVKAIAPGTRWAQASHPGFVKLESVQVKVLPGMEALRLVLRRAATLSGKVLDPSGRLVAIYAISASAGDAGARAAPDVDVDMDDLGDEHREPRVSASVTDGGFSLDVAGGSYTLKVRASGFPEASLPANAPASGLVVQLHTGARVRGSVVDEHGKPMKASVFTRGAHARTDEAGQFDLKGLPAGTLELRAMSEAGGAEESSFLAEETLSLREGEEKTVVLRARGA